jgi:hypothetical protein
VCDGKQLALAPLSRVYEDAVDRLENQVEKAGATTASSASATGQLPASACCRPTRAQRKASPRPLLDALRAKFADDSPYTVLLIKDLEADDVCGISAGRLRAAGSAASSSPRTRTSSKSQGWSALRPRTGSSPSGSSPEQAADDWHMMQTLAGDVCDNYKGSPVGVLSRPVTSSTSSTMAGLSPAERWEEIVARFVEGGPYGR